MEDTAKSFVKARFLRALDDGECPVCELVKEKENGYLEDILMELVNDAKFRDKLMKRGGLCLKHFHKLILLAGNKPALNGVGISDILRDLIRVKIHELERMDKDLSRIRSKPPLPADEEINILTRVVRRLFGRV